MRATYLFFQKNFFLSFNSIEYTLEDRQLLAVDAVQACHHPLAVTVNRTLWLKMVKYLDLQPKQLISQFSNNIKNSYIAGFRCNNVSIMPLLRSPYECRLLASLPDAN